MRKKLQKIAVIDIETTGFKPWTGEIVEIGITELNLQTGETKELFNSLILEKGNFKSTEWIFKNTDLSFEMVKQSGKSLDFVRNDIQAIFDQYYMIAYNQTFDFDFMEDRNFIVKYKLRDIMRDLPYILKLPKKRGSGFKWPNVQECIDNYEINETEIHRALSDTLQEAQIIYRANKKGDFVINSAKHRVNSNEEEELRYLSKVESYQNIRHMIKDECIAEFEQKLKFVQDRVDSY